MTSWRLAILLAVSGLMACDKSTVEPVASLTIDLSASTEIAAPGDTISLVAAAKGPNLVGLEIDFGDTTSEIYPTHGASQARVTFRHAYTARGTFTVRVVVTDGTADQKDDSVDIRVN
ncbi:MAG: hypothetical protein MNPFHGCM_02654 [Gemmatimonadaceae bacterium]|nr:hypothetical protein [Gemmatimonadaceae bacterium]